MLNSVGRDDSDGHVFPGSMVILGGLGVCVHYEHRDRERETKIFDIHNKVISHDKNTMRVYIPI